jgi:hypothetical protein
LVIDLASAAPVEGGRDTVMVPPVDVARVTVPVDKPATTEADDDVIVPLTFPVVDTLMPAELGVPDPPPGAPPTADGVVAPGVGFGENVPPAALELPPVSTPLLSEPLLVGAVAKLTLGLCEAAEVETARTAAAHKAALLNGFVIESSLSGYELGCSRSSVSAQ